jgi:hypothetical protein
MTKQFQTKFLVFLVLLFVFIFPFLIVSAATTTTSGPNLTYDPMETLPGFTKTADFAVFISNLYKFGIWTVGICALIMIVIGGYMYAASGGNNASMEKAKRFITDAIAGLILALLAYLILYIINPELVKIKMGSASTATTPFPANCTGTIPDNSTLCTSTNPTASTAISLVATCASAPCTYGCNTSYTFSSGKCIATTPPATTGLTPAEKEACEKMKSQVSSQCKDASSKLNDLLECMNKSLGDKIQISSISDGNGGVNCYQDHSTWSQCTSNTQTNCCFHAKNSCHYGGTVGGASCAVDFSDKGSSASNTEIEGAAKSCGATYTESEGDNVHASVGGCGCN